VDFQIPVFAIKREDNETYYQHVHEALNPRFSRQPPRIYVAPVGFDL
jgi:hypothetical protein